MRLRNPFVRSAKESVVPIGLDPVMSQFLRMGRMDAATSPSGALSLFEQSSIVSVPVLWISSLFSSIRPVIQQSDGTFVTEDPILDLLRRPSPEYTAKLFFEHLAINYLVTGEVGVIGIGVLTQPPIQLAPLTPKDYEPISGENNVVDRYQVAGSTWTGTYRREVVDARRTRYVADNLREMKQIRNFSTVENGLRRGLSPISMAAREVRQHILGGTHNVSILEKGGRVSLLFHIKANLTPDQYEQEKKRILSAYGGASEAGKIGVTAGEELEIKEVGQTAKDMDFINLIEKARATLLLQYRVPLALAFIDASTLDNYRIGKVAIYDDAALPLADAIFDGLTDFLVPRFGRDPAQERITYDKKQIGALESRLLEQLKLRKDIGIETLDELRTKGMGLDDYDPPADDDEDATPGDFIYAPSSMTPIGSDPLPSGGLEDIFGDQPPGGPEDTPPGGPPENEPDVDE